MSLMERIPKDFYKLFSSKYTDYYMLFLTAIYEEMSLSYSVLGLTEKECRAVMNEKIAAAALLWDEENYDEEGEFLTRSNMASVCLKHFQEWGWLKQADSGGCRFGEHLPGIPDNGAVADQTGDGFMNIPDGIDEELPFN